MEKRKILYWIALYIAVVLVVHFLNTDAPLSLPFSSWKLYVFSLFPVAIVILLCLKK